jgi:putative ABC transport system permease protein
VAPLNLSGILYIYRTRLESRTVLVQEGFAILGIAVGVALLFASQVSSASLAGSVSRLNDELVGSAQFQLDARGPEGFEERLLEEVRRLPGVRVALPVFERQVNVIGPGGERSIDMVGIDPNSVRASGALLRRFSARQIAAQRAIALPAPLAGEIGVGPLQVVKLQIGTDFVETLVGATLGQADIGGVIHSPVAVTSLGYAQRLAGARGQVTRIFVRSDPARTGEVRAALTRLAATVNINLQSGKFDSRLFAVAVAPESQSEALFSGISAVVGFMFALNAMLITVPSRRKLIEDVRPHGATRLMTIEILLFDAAVLGVLACALGLALGDVLSIAVFRSSPGYLAFAFPVGNDRIVTWQSVAVAVATGMGAAVLGVLWPVRQILARPLQPPADRADRRRVWTAARLAGGGLCLVLTTFALLADTRLAIVGNIALAVALLCLLPLLFDVLVVLFEHVSNALDGIGSALAVTELQTPQTRVRSLAIAATAAVAVFGIVEFQGTQTNLKSGLDASTRDLDSGADIWVTPRGTSSLLTTVPFKPVDTAALTDVPGVARLGIYRGSLLNWGDRRLEIRGQPSSTEHPIPPSQFLGEHLGLATARVRRGGWAALSQTLAAEHHLHTGEAFTLPSPKPITLKVAALTTNLGWPPGAIVLNSEDYARAWASGDPSAYEIQTAAGADAATVRDRIRSALRSETGLAVETTMERERRHYALAAEGLARVTQIRLLVLIAAILAVTGTMGAMIWQRRGLIASLKCHGYGEGVLWRWLLCESAILLTVGCSIGAVFGLYAQLLGSHFLARATGFPIVFNVEGLAAISSFGLVGVTAVAVLALPGYLAVRVRPRTTSPAY